MLTAALASGCGALVDKDNIRIAKFGDRFITRGELNEVIRNMPAEERPDIRTQADVRKALESYIDLLVKEELADQVEAQRGGPLISREMAAQRYYAEHPDQRNLDIENPEAVGLTAEHVAFMKEERELAIDRLEKKLRAEAAVMVRAEEEMKAGMRPTEEEYQNEYEFRKDMLKNLEAIVFRGVYFPASQDDAIGKAAELRERLKAGEDLDTLITEYTTTKGGQPLESGIENNPALPKFYGFWQQASGAKLGDVIGPIFIQGWDAIRQNEQGQAVGGRLPNSYLTCKIIEYRPESPKTYEQAKPDLTPPLCYAKVMRQLREAKGVEIYEDKLPDPSLYDEDRAKSIFDQKQ
jgi:hypothetical protein